MTYIWCTILNTLSSMLSFRILSRKLLSIKLDLASLVVARVCTSLPYKASWSMAYLYVKSSEPPLWPSRGLQSYTFDNGRTLGRGQLQQSASWLLLPDLSHLGHRTGTPHQWSSSTLVHTSCITCIKSCSTSNNICQSMLHMCWLVGLTFAFVCHMSFLIRSTFMGAFKCYVTLFFWKLDPHPPPRNANNIEHYTFVTLLSRKSDTPTPICIT